MPKIQSNTVSGGQEKGEGSSCLPFMEGAFLFLVALSPLKLEAYPTPKRTEYRYQDNS
jgi:hypothetical protein